LAATPPLQVPLRIILVDPPRGVRFAVQQGRSGLVGGAVARGSDLRFDFTIKASRSADGSLRLGGEFVQGPAGGKFIYINSGTSAGQPSSPWTRRAKVGLKTLTWLMIQRAMSKGACLQVRIAGKSRDGGPACATVPLLDGGWAIAAD
jgi:hypothetical protein